MDKYEFCQFLLHDGIVFPDFLHATRFAACASFDTTFKSILYLCDEISIGECINSRDYMVSENDLIGFHSIANLYMFKMFLDISVMRQRLMQFHIKQAKPSHAI